MIYFFFKKKKKSAGIGRSGTFCAVHSTLEYIKHMLQIKQNPTFNMVKLISRLREQRPGMVQTKVKVTLLKKRNLFFSF